MYERKQPVSKTELHTTPQPKQSIIMAPRVLVVVVSDAIWSVWHDVYWICHIVFMICQCVCRLVLL